MRVRQRASCISAVALVVSVTGCVAPTAATCASWVDFESSADMAEASDLVVVTDRFESDGTERFFDVDAHAYSVTVGDVIKGDVAVGSVIRVVSTPDSCSTDFHPGGDQLDVSDPVRIYLVRDDGILRTVTPFAGVERLP